jgi:hypothetical protein
VPASGATLPAEENEGTGEENEGTGEDAFRTAAADCDVRGLADDGAEAPGEGVRVAAAGCSDWTAAPCWVPAKARPPMAAAPTSAAMSVATASGRQ